MKKLEQFLEAAAAYPSGYLKTKSPDEQRFVNKHEVKVKPDANGNGDDVFKASNIKTVERKTAKDNHGYDRADSVAVYEESTLDEALDAADRFHHHHAHAKNLLKSIGERLKDEHMRGNSHVDHRTGKKGPQWGHVSSMDEVASQLAHIHDRLARTGEYAPTNESTKASSISTNNDTLFRLLQDISEANQVTLFAVFESLSNDNQLHFINNCETDEGIESMLNFAIQNRGE